MKKYVEITTPADAITAAEFKADALIADVDFDAVKIPLRVAQATREFEDLTYHLTTNRTIELHLDVFPADGTIELERTPIGSVTKVEYYDLDNVLQTLDTSLYDVEIVGPPGRICLAQGAAWPATMRRPGAVIVTFVAGYGALKSDVPLQVKAAIISLARDRFQRLPRLDPDTNRQIETLRWRHIYVS